jgi:hypothetical protein
MATKKLISVIELGIGDQVQVEVNPRGVFVGTVTGFDPRYPDNNVAIITPDRAAVRDVFPDGYTIGRQHWTGSIKILRRYEP